MAFAASRRLVRNRQLCTLMAAWTAFYIGAFSHFVLVVTFLFAAGGASTVGVATVAVTLPAGLLGPLAAPLAASARPELHLAFGIGSRCVAMAATIATVLSHGSIDVVLVLVTVESLLSAGVRPLHGALVVRLSNTAGEAAAGNALTSSLVSAAALAGPALAGTALDFVGIAWAFALPAFFFAVAMAAALLIRVPRADEDSSRSSGGSAAPRGSQLKLLGAGFRGIFSSRAAAAATMLFAVNVIVLGVWYVGAAPVAAHRLHLGKGGVATIMAFYGAGGLVGALATLSIVTWRRLAGVLGAGLLGLAAVFAALGTIGSPPVGLALAAVLGAAGAVIYAIAPTLVQRGVSREAMVPAVATLQSLYLVGEAAGAVVTPLLLGSLGVAATFGLVGGVTALATLLAWPQLRGADKLSDEDAAKLAVIRAAPMLQPLPALALEQLARVATRVAVPAGCEVFRQGDRGDRLYVIAAGLAEIAVDGSRVATLGPGGSFGEIALLHKAPRSSTVTAREDLDLIAIEGEEFLSALSTDSVSVGRVGRIVRARMDTPPVAERFVELSRDDALSGGAARELLAAQPPMATIEATALGELADTARVLAAGDGALITREGDYGDTYYVIVDGAATVFEGDTEIRELRPGDGFGELAILRDVPRTATVRALGDTTLLAVDRDAFHRARHLG
ncbi:cyclic nucleotide-binding domain-containing protein [Mycobacterium sp. Aquia_213]|uniref:cyclic nucleotide-binding domain-containing protein n=1 Tax=Mycobacterium sp. Aquia_213 TaxID=2991728 RepID=UPI00226EEC24|nr:cyclic nucleotide-binding domain-containing protein [Mycobacterium sp. Aquia_213]WAC91166.1 cyclic nucleotide-binding domain-containing protein [Mycobacterium sp. Aquia_213]